MENGITGNSRAVTVALYAALTYDIISATNSSPQTTEINASTRAETLMKWVRLGLLQAGGFAILGAILDKERWPPILGAGIAGSLLWVQYKHAEKAGLESTEPSTETYGEQGSDMSQAQPTEPNIQAETPFTELPAMS